MSFLFTMSILIGTVVAIYMLLPARDGLLITEAISKHRDSGPWEIENPSNETLRGWAIAVVGKEAPLPPAGSHVIGARQLTILKRRAALIRLQLGDDQVTYLVQHARGIMPDHSSRTDGELRAEQRKRGKFTIVGVGPAATDKTWTRLLFGP
ncbi:MAG TPA: hypothetical protein VMZ53_05935 [Kofleriaceae bacterium]|nr:hypothetical protein [Kofleriaceae bacterium]